MESTTKLGFIGGGHMATALISGLVRQQLKAENIIVADPVPDALKRLRTEVPGVRTTQDNAETLLETDGLVLAVKPDVLQGAIQQLAAKLRQKRPLLVSIAAGIPLARIAEWLQDDTLPMVRCMPNTPALLGCGATALYANPHVNEYQLQLAERLMEAVGITCHVNTEEQLDAITALSGSGPAYFFLVMEALRETGTALGLPAEISNRFTLQTALGAARLATEGDMDIAQLRRQVTSPGGTTECALEVLQEGGLTELFARALTAAAARARELGQADGGKN